MNYLMKCLIFSMLILSFVSCEKNNELSIENESEELSIELRDDDVEENVLYYYLGGTGGFAETNINQCVLKGACMSGWLNVMYSPEEELIIEAAAKDLCLAKITKIHKNLLRVDLVFSPEGYEESLELEEDQVNKFFIRESGLFADGMEVLGMSTTKGISNGVYTIEKQEEDKVWSGHFLVNHKNFN